MKEILHRLSSRKFLLPILFVVLVTLNKTFEWKLAEEEIQRIFTLFLAFIGVEGGADLVTRFTSQKP